MMENGVTDFFQSRRKWKIKSLPSCKKNKIVLSIKSLSCLYSACIPRILLSLNNWCSVYMC